MRILFVHGVNVASDDESGALVERELREAGVPCEVTDGRWPSSGSFMGDAALFVAPQFRADADEAVAHALQDFALAGVGVVLSHSMGTVLALHAERTLRTGLPMVCLASPLSNPAIRPALIALGYGREPREPAIHLWNDDDPIPGGKLADQPSYFQAVRIAVADNEAKAFSTEHDVRPYLRHPHVANALRLAGRRDDA